MLKTIRISILTFILIFVDSQLLAQDKSLDVEIGSHEKAVSYNINDLGNSAIVLWDKKSKTSKILNYNSSLELNYSKSFPSSFKDNSGFSGGAIRPVFYYDLALTNSGDYIYGQTDDLIFNKQGDYKSFNLKIDGESEDYVNHLSFITDKFTCVLGSSKNKVKKKILYKDFILKRKSNIDLSEKAIVIPSIYHGVENWFSLSLAGAFDDEFYMVSKDFDKEKKNNNYHLMSYDYDGQKLSDVVIPVNLENKYFMASNNGGGEGVVKSHTWLNSGKVEGGTTTHSLDYNSISNIHLDRDNGVLYIYGLYTNKKENDSYNASYGGYYIHKYTLEGKEVWKLQNAIVDKSDFNKAAVAYFMEVNFIKLTDGKLGFTVHKSNTKQFAHFFVVNDLNGKLEKNEKIKYKVSKIRLQGMKKGHAFPTGFNMKEDFGKLNLDFNCLFASYLSEKFKAYLASKKETSLAYNCKITEKGIYLIQENMKENEYKLMKFDW